MILNRSNANRWSKTISIEVKTCNGYVLITAKDHVSIDDIVALFKTLRQNIFKGKRLKLLIDDRDETFDASFSIARKLANLFTENSDILESRVAVVVTTTLSYGIGRMVASILAAYNFELNIYKDFEVAESWLIK